MAGQTCILSKDRTDNPKLCAKKMTDGRISLYLSHYMGYRKEPDPATGRERIRTLRCKEFLNLYLYCSPRTRDQRRHNADAEDLAKRIRYEREQERRLAETGHRIPRRAETDFLQYFREYIANYTKKDIRNIRMAYNRFVGFLSGTPAYRSLAKGIRPSQIDRDMMLSFADYLREHSVGNGARSVFDRFRKVVRHAIDHDVFRKDPCSGISIRTDTALTKEILSPDELRSLATTPYTRENVKRAFLFCCLTGLRFCDVRELTFSNVDYSNRLLKFRQRKTEGHSAHSGVTIPMNDSILTLMGERRGAGESIFALPSHGACLKDLRVWTRKAGIAKHITWHCARHSFAVMLLSGGADIKTASSLLGHSSITMTERYLHVVDSQRQAAIDSLPTLF